MPHHFPLIPASDLAGIVDEVGAGVDWLIAGDHVFGQVGQMELGHGSLAEYTIASAGTIAKRPDSIDPEFGAALPLAGVSALQSIEPIGLKQGDVVVILGAGGGIGGFATQIAKNEGAVVVGIAGRDKLDYVRSLGADEAIDYAATDVVEAVTKAHRKGIKAVVHTAGDAETLAGLAGLVSEGGFVVSMRGGAKVDELAARHITGVNVTTRTTTSALDQLSAMVTAGDVKRPAIKTFTLADAGSAFAEIGHGHVRGKLVVLL
jgi:NADPH2:quinone reductase